MKITSPVFGDQQKIPGKYTCVGENVNPPLEFSEVPQNAKSLAFIMDDPDAIGTTWVHWVVFNISPTVGGFAENSKPDGTESVTSFRSPGYGGPCPPEGVHRYFFKLYALDTMLDLKSDASVSTVEDAMTGHIIEHAELVGLFSK